MGEHKFSASVVKDGVKLEFKDGVFTYPEDPAEFSAKFGEDVVELAVQEVARRIQSSVRSALAAGKTPEEIEAIIANWKAGAKNVGGGGKKKGADLGAILDIMPIEKRKEFAQLAVAGGLKLPEKYKDLLN